MDAASNTGVDNIRSIIDEVNFIPTKLKYRVYIIDEAHMLSNSAWNAFLKTLEEPPAHVKFILATTEPQKILPTILSRCQRFDFKKIDENDILNHLKKISKKVNIDLEENALKLISNLADGSMRDGISILESVRSIDRKVTLDDIRQLVGIPNFIDISSLLNGVFSGNNSVTINLANKLITSGKEASNIIAEILKMIETLIIYTPETLSKYNDEEKKEIEKLKNLIISNKIDVYMNICKLNDIYNNLKLAYNKNVILLASLIAITEENKNVVNNIRQNTASAQSLINNIKKDNFKKTDEGKKNIIYEDKDSLDSKDKYKKKEKKKISKENVNAKTKSKESSNNILGDNTRTVDFWNAVMQNMVQKKQFRIFANLVQAKVQIINDILEIKVTKNLTEIDKNYLQEKATIDKIKDAINEETGSNLNIKIFFRGEDD